MNTSDFLKISALCGLLAAPLTSDAQTFTLDGYRTGADSYTDKAAIFFFNGHQPEAYGDQNNPIYQTFVRWGVGTLAGDNSGTEYFFMYVETPIEVKNMIWGNEITAQDIAEYDVHYSNHHGDDPNMDYGQATGSEFMAFFDSDGKEVFETQLDGNGDTNFGKGFGDYGFVDARTSLDYMFANGATEADSADASVNGREIGMAFEYQFALNTTENNALLDTVRNGGIIEYHLSPERGLVPTQVPEPTSALMAMLGGVAFLFRRRR